MDRRATFVAAAAALLVWVPAGRSGAASAPPSADEFTGQWTPDSTSASLFVDHAFRVTSGDQTTATNAVGADLLPSFDAYCDPAQSGPPVEYFTLSYTWAPDGTMGGCKSPKTGSHVYVWGSHEDVSYIHPETVKGEPVVKGAWGLADPDTHSVAYQKLTAHHPLVRFLTKIRHTQIIKKGKHVARITKVSGVGSFRVDAKPTNCVGTDTQDGDGLLHVHITKVGGNHVVDLDDLTVDIDPDSGRYARCDTNEVLSSIPVVVKTSDPDEKDSCPVRSLGELVAADKSKKMGGDHLVLKIPKCDLDLTLRQATARGNDHVAVAIGLDQKGY